MIVAKKRKIEFPGLASDKYVNDKSDHILPKTNKMSNQHLCMLVLAGLHTYENLNLKASLENYFLQIRQVHITFRANVIHKLDLIRSPTTL